MGEINTGPGSLLSEPAKDGVYNGANLQAVDCNSESTYHHWSQNGGRMILTDENGGWIQGGMCLDRTDGGNRPDKPIQIWMCYDNNQNQQWSVVKFYSE